MMLKLTPIEAQAKVDLGSINEAKSDFQTTLELAEQQGEYELKTHIEEWLRRLNQIDSKHKNHKQPRRGGQWKGKVKMTEDFDELPESFTSFFSGEDE